MARNSGPTPPARVGQDHLSPDLIDKFLDIQQADLQLRTKQLAIDAQHEENNRIVAEKSIEANVQDRTDERSHVERRTRILFIGFTIILVLILCFCGFALYIGKGEIVYKIAEVVGLFSAGFAGGYGTKAARSAHREQQPAKQ